MTWTTPEISRSERALVAPERAALDASLDYQRSTFLFKCGGLSAQQLAARPLEPSALSLLGIARHLADCERAWFRMRFAGEGVEGIYYTEDNPDADFHDGTAESAPGDMEAYRKEIAAARAVTAGRSLDQTFIRPHDGRSADLRWLFFHMIEEYARHNGHADLLREHIDGSTGE